MSNSNNVFAEAGAKKIAKTVLNGFIPNGTNTGISKKEITITGAEYKVERLNVNFKPTTTVYTNDDLDLAEVGFNVSGATYQKLIDGMATKAGRGPGSSNPFPTSVGQVDPNATYHFELGLGLQTFSNNYGAPLYVYWQGDVQVTDAVTGQGSMGYEWNGNLDGWSTPEADKKALKRILGSASSGFKSTFDQPTTSGTATKVPQQPVAQAYVETKLDRFVGTVWPAQTDLRNEQGSRASGLFDPILGSTTPFVPNSFGV